MSCYSKYHGQSTGRILHFLEHYCGLSVAEHVQIGSCEVTLYGKQIATFHFEGDVPVFRFDEARYNEAQEEKRDEAIRDGKPRWPERVGASLAVPAECFLAIGDGGPTDALIEYEHTLSHRRSFALAIERAADKVANRIEGLGKHAPSRAAYVNAIEMGAKALKELEAK